MLRRDEYLVGERLHLDSIPGNCLTRVVCSLHQHLLTQLGQPALHHTASTQARRPSQERDPGHATLTVPMRPFPSRLLTPCITAKHFQNGTGLSLPQLKKDFFIHHPKVVVQAGDNASEDPLLLSTLYEKGAV